MLLKIVYDAQEIDLADINVAHIILKISDFGLCRQLTESRASKSITMSVVGTTHWMAPEVKKAMWLDGLSEAKYTKYSDIWACGLVSYYMFKKDLPSRSYYVIYNLKNKFLNNCHNTCKMVQK